VRHFVDHIKVRDSENLFGGTTTQQASTLTRVPEKCVDKDIGVNEKMGAGGKTLDQLRRHD
jgi:hypothetical protein